MHVVNSSLLQAPSFRLPDASVRFFRHTVAPFGPHGWWAFLRSMRFDRFLLSPGMLHAPRAPSKGPERPTFSPTPFFTIGPEGCLGYPGSVTSQSVGTGNRPCADAPWPKPPSHQTESCHQEMELLLFGKTPSFFRYVPMILAHYCPVISRTTLAGYQNHLFGFCRSLQKTPVEWVFSRKV